MDEKSQQSISRENEIYTCEWFKAADFDCEKIREKSRPDFLCIKDDLKIICEVKTIFSGGQAGLDENQFERRREQQKQQFEEAKKNLPPGQPLLTTQDYLDYLEGKIPYKKTWSRKENEFNNLCDEVKNALINDDRIKELNFEITIRFESIDTDAKDRIYDFVDFIVNHIYRIKHLNNIDISLLYEAATAKFIFNHPTKDSTGNRTRGDFAFIQFSKNDDEQGLQVEVVKDFMPYNENRISETLTYASGQINNIKSEHKGALTTIGLWSHSQNILSNRLLFEGFNKLDGEIPERYYILDHFFEGRDLDAIIFFEKRTHPTAFGLVITNPYKPDLEKQFEEIFAPLGEQYRVVLGIKK